MSDSANNDDGPIATAPKEPAILTGSMSDDDLARVVRMPGVDRHQLDGGNSFNATETLQKGDNLFSGSMTAITPHSQHSNGAGPVVTNRGERASSGEYEVAAGHVFKSQKTGLRQTTYVEASADYHESKLTRFLQNAWHKLTLGKSADAKWTHKMPSGTAAGVLIADRVEKTVAEVKGVEFVPEAHIAVEGGTDRLAGEVGAGLTIGHHPERLPLSLPNANPEAPIRPYVADPSLPSKGSWAVHATVEKYDLSQNRFLTGAPFPNKHPMREAVELAFAVSNKVALGAYAERYGNPAHGLGAGPESGPKNNTNAGFRFTLRF